MTSGLHILKKFGGGKKILLFFLLSWKIAKYSSIIAYLPEKSQKIPVLLLTYILH
jgi:hypothetical protein